MSREENWSINFTIPWRDQFFLNAFYIFALLSLSFPARQTFLFLSYIGPGWWKDKILVVAANR